MEPPFLFLIGDMKRIKCPFCKKEHIVKKKVVPPVYGFLEDIPGFTVYTYDCPSCDIHESSLDDDKPLIDRLKRLEEVYDMKENWELYKRLGAKEFLKGSC